MIGCGLSMVSSWAEVCVTWWERPAGSPAELEAAQKRFLEVFQSCRSGSLTFHQFLVSGGEFGGTRSGDGRPRGADTVDDGVAVFQFRGRAVMEVMDAVAADSESIEWRDSITGA